MDTDTTDNGDGDVFLFFLKEKRNTLIHTTVQTGDVGLGEIVVLRRSRDAGSDQAHTQSTRSSRLNRRVIFLLCFGAQMVWYAIRICRAEGPLVVC